MTTAPPVAPTQEQISRWASTKFGLLAHGAVLTTTADAAMHDVKKPIRTRSGVSGGLDITIDDCIHVNVPIVESFVRESPYKLDFSDGNFIIQEGTETLTSFQPLPTPEYYHKQTLGDRESMRRIGQMCSADRFCYGMTGPTCYFWRRDRRCRYCSIGKNYSADAARKQEHHLMEVLGEALTDRNLPARHVLLGGGTPTGDDMGATLAAELTVKIKEKYDIPIYVMIAAPLDNRYIDELKAAGVDELGMNLEFWSEQAWKRYIPGKDSVIGRNRYLEALEYAVNLFGPINTRSILIAGLEPPEETEAAAIHLAQMGVMPIISPFRPLEDTMLAQARGFTGPQYVKLWYDLTRAIDGLGIPLGPACIACQNNTLALPVGNYYRSNA